MIYFAGKVGCNFTLAINTQHSSLVAHGNIFYESSPHPPKGLWQCYRELYKPHIIRQKQVVLFDLIIIGRIIIRVRQDTTVTFIK